MSCKFQTHRTLLPVALASIRTVLANVISVRVGTVTVILALLAAAAMVSCGPTAQPDPPRRDLLLITLDTTRADRMSLYGHPVATTPMLDDLARESVVFDLAIAQAAVTPVSHASIFTGLQPFHHGLRVLHGLVGNRLPEDAVTLAEVWNASGGRSAAFVSAYPVTENFGLHQGFDPFDDQFENVGKQDVVDDTGLVNVSSSQRRADETTQAAIQWLRETSADPRPLLLWVHYFDPHDTLVRPPDRIQRKFPSVSREPADMLRAIYDAEVYFMDAQIGRLLEAFKSQRSWDETVVAVVGDHGEGLGDHDWWSHGVLYQEQIRVPMMVRAPQISGGSRVASVVRTLDLMPTALELAGVGEGNWPVMDGSSLVEAMSAGATSEPRLAYSDSVNILSYARLDDPSEMNRKSDKLYAVTDGRYKLIYHQLAPENSEFYDLESDPGELENLASQRPAAMTELMRRLAELDAFSDIMPGMTDSDAERLERLKSLGYVQ